MPNIFARSSQSLASSLLRKTSLALLLVLFPAAVAIPARTPSCDSCQVIQAQIDSLNAQIYALGHPVSAPPGPGHPEKPHPLPVDPSDQAKIELLRKQVSVLTEQLNACHRPSPDPPPLAVKPFTASGIGAPDPQIAVGHKFIAAIDTSNLVFLDKATRATVASVAFPNHNGVISLHDVFSSLYSALDKAMNLPKDRNVCTTDNEDFDNKFEPDHPNRFIPGCVDASYDTRVLYDNERHRFWIASATRHPLYLCTEGSAETPGVSFGLQNDDGTYIDPASKSHPSDSAKCHTDWDQKWVHRFVCLAVTRVDKNGNEDLSKPPFIYALWEDMGDWPLMALHGNYLVVTHRETKHGTDDVAVFDADRLSNPHTGDDGSVLKISPLAVFHPDDLAFSKNEKKFTPADVMFPVNIHGSSARDTYLVSFSGDSLLVLGFRSPLGDPSGKPEKLPGDYIPLGRPTEHVPQHNPEYRDGMLYVAWNECVGPTPCSRFMIRILRIPVDTGGGPISASDDPAKGFLDCRFTDQDEAVSLFVPQLAVNKNDDMVVAFDHVAFAKHVATGVRLRVWFHNHGNISDGAWIKEGATLPAKQSIPDPSGGGVVDLGSAVVDPDDDVTVWISHAFTPSSGGFQEIVTAVKP